MKEEGGRVKGVSRREDSIGVEMSPNTDES